MHQKLKKMLCIRSFATFPAVSYLLIFFELSLEFSRSDEGLASLQIKMTVRSHQVGPERGHEDVGPGDARLRVEELEPLLREEAHADGRGVDGPLESCQRFPSLKICGKTVVGLKTNDERFF